MTSRSSFPMTLYTFLALSLSACEDTTHRRDTDLSQNETSDNTEVSGGEDTAEQMISGAGVEGGAEPEQEVLSPILVPEFGRIGERQVVTAARRSDGLSHPRDLEFDPDVSDQLWIVDRDWDGNIILFEAGSDTQSIERLRDMAASHFMDEVSSVAFSNQQSFATCQESRNTMDGAMLFPDDFMGPVLWSSDLSIHCAVNQREVFGGLNGSHLDMLHQSPLCMGIAHRDAHIFFVADGTHGHIVRYDFQEPHIPGGDDHSDGRVSRYTELSFTRVPDIPSHMQVVGDELFYIDTGAGVLRVADLTTGAPGEDLIPENEPLELFNTIRGVRHRVLVEGLDTPSGLAVLDERIFISLPRSGEIVAFDRDGLEVERFATNKPGVMGLEIGPQGRLWYVNAYEGTVNWIDPTGEGADEPTSPISPRDGACQYPEWDGRVGLGHVLPPFQWSSASEGGRITDGLSALEIFCGESWRDVETVIFVVVPEWAPWLEEYVMYIDALAPLIEDEGGRVIYVGAQTKDGAPMSLSKTQTMLRDATPQERGILVAEQDHLFDFPLMNTTLIRHLPSSFIVRRADMRVIATQITRGMEHLPYVEIAQQPEADWSDPGPATILPVLPSNCDEGDEEGSEPNNTPEEATLIGVGEVNGGICERRGDFYFIDVVGSWSLNLEFSHAVGDIDMILFADGQPMYDERGYPIGAGSGTDNETFQWRGPQMVYIYGFDGATSPYKLTISTP